MPDVTRDNLSRIRKSVREIFVVVASILIAFSLDAWWDARQEQAAQVELLRSLAADFEVNQQELEAWVVFHERSLQGTRSFLEVARSVRDGTRAEVSDTVIANTQFTPTFEPIRGTLELALASGALSQVPSAHLKRQLVRWPELVDDTREDEMRARTLVRDALLPLLRSQSDVEAALGAALDRVGGVGTDEPGYSERYQETTTAVFVSPELRGMLADRELAAVMALRALGDIRVLQDSILAEIGAVLARLN